MSLLQAGVLLGRVVLLGDARGKMTIRLDGWSLNRR